MKSTLKRVLFLAVAAAVIPACGGGGGAGVTARGGGGSASGAPGSTYGGLSGDFEVFANGPITFGVNAAQPQSPTPAAPAAATEITDLTADVVEAGSAQITGVLTGSGAATRTITVGGDLRISGTLISGQSGGAQIDLIINALDGTVYISGLIRSTSVDGTLDGTEGGSITINANDIVLTGRIESKGEAGATTGGTGGDLLFSTVAGNAGADILVHRGTIDLSGGIGTTSAGDGGDVSFNSEDSLELYGTLTSTGGNVQGTGDNVAAGSGGDVDLDATDVVYANATFRLTGGNAVTSGDGATAGAGGDLRILDAGVPTQTASIFGLIDLAGGRASASVTGVNSVYGGDGGYFLIGDSSDATNGPSLVDLPRAALDLSGGDSNGLGGYGAEDSNIETATGGIIFNGFVSIDAGVAPEGGGDESSDFYLTADNGDVVVNGVFTGNGGSGNVDPGSGEQFYFQAVNGDLTFNAQATANAGHATGAADLDGEDADAGSINFNFILGDPATTLTFSASARLTAHGGRGAGDGNGGNGGSSVMVGEGTYLIAGVHVMNGGNASGTGTGGMGGWFSIDSDDNNDGTGGDITLQAGTSLTLNGGTGAVGGSGRSNAVELDADGGNTNVAANNGVIINNGSITTRGAATDGDGGGVHFDGSQAGGLLVGPLPGTQDRSANGAGTAGTFLGD